MIYKKAFKLSWSLLKRVLFSKLLIIVPIAQYAESGNGLWLLLSAALVLLHLALSLLAAYMGGGSKSFDDLQKKDDPRRDFPFFQTHLAKESCFPLSPKGVKVEDSPHRKSWQALLQRRSFV